MGLLKQRKSVRLEGFDYRQDANYFVTINATHRRCLFGTISGCEVKLSEFGLLVEREWLEIPQRNNRVILGPHQIMPNHLHGIVTLKPLGRKLKAPVQLRRVFGKPIPGSLSSILGSFKCGVTLRAHQAGMNPNQSFWQPRFYDHIIRDDISYFMIELYIQLNPLLWEFDIENPEAKGLTVDELRRILNDRYGIPGSLAAVLLEQDMMSRIKRR